MVRVGEAVPQPPHGTPAVVREGPEAQVGVRRRADREFLDDHEEGAVGAERRADRAGRISHRWRPGYREFREPRRRKACFWGT
jgi:hypothetical protein